MVCDIAHKGKVSVIIPIYNIENYVVRSINSVMNQTYKNLEIICINDGSTDCSGEILEELRKQDNRIRVITQKNKGVSQARNVGLENAIGEYIYFFDGDDYIDKSLLENVTSILKNKDISMVSFGYKIVDKTKITSICKYKYNKKNFSTKEFLKKMLKKDINQHICSFVIKKENLNDIYFNSELITGEDLDFQFRVLLYNNFNIYYDSREYFYYYRRENSATRKKNIPYKNLKTLDYLDLLRKDMFEEQIEEFRVYNIIRFFNIARSLAIYDYRKEDYFKIVEKFKKYDYILNDLDFSLNNKQIVLYILKVAYNIDFKLLLLIFKVANIFKFHF